MVLPPARVRHHLEGTGDFIRMGDHSDDMIDRFYKGKRLYRDMKSDTIPLCIVRTGCLGVRGSLGEAAL